MSSAKSKLRKVLTQNTFLRSILILMGGTAGSQLITVLASPIVTRLYSPDDFGLLAVYASIITVLSIVANLGYELAIPVAKDNDTAILLLVAGVISTLVISLATLIKVTIISEDIAQFLGMAQLRQLTWLIPIGVLGIGMYRAFSYWAIRIRSFQAVAQTRVQQSITLVATQLALGISGLGALGLVIGQIAGSCAGTIRLARLAPKQARTAIYRWSSIWTVAKQFSRFPLLSTPAAVLNRSSLILPALLLSALFDPAAAGWFALADRVIKNPLNLISRSTAQVYLAESADVHNSRGPAELKRMFLKTSRTLFFIGLAPITVVAVFGPNMFAFLFGDSWRMSGTYAQLLSPMFLGHFVVSPLAATLFLLHRQDLQILLDGLRLIGVTVGFILTSSGDQTAPTAILTYGIVMAIAYLLTYMTLLKVLSNATRNQPTPSGA